MKILFYAGLGTWSISMRKSLNNVITFFCRLINMAWLIAFWGTLFIFVYKISNWSFFPFELNKYFSVAGYVLGALFLIWVLILVLFVITGLKTKKNNGEIEDIKSYYTFWIFMVIGLGLSTASGYFLASFFGIVKSDIITTVALMNSLSMLICYIPYIFAGDATRELHYAIKRNIDDEEIYQSLGKALIVSTVIEVIWDLVMIAFIVFVVIPLIRGGFALDKLTEKLNSIKAVVYAVSAFVGIITGIGKIVSKIKNRKG